MRGTNSLVFKVLRASIPMAMILRPFDITHLTNTEECRSRLSCPKVVRITMTLASLLFGKALEPLWHAAFALTFSVSFPLPRA